MAVIMVAETDPKPLTKGYQMKYNNHIDPCKVYLTFVDIACGEYVREELDTVEEALLRTRRLRRKWLKDYRVTVSSTHFTYSICLDKHKLIWDCYYA